MPPSLSGAELQGIHHHIVAGPARNLWGLPALCTAVTVSTSDQHSVIYTPRRGASTMTGAGIPKPRGDVQQALSTHRGGHISRSLLAAKTLFELERALSQHADSLQPEHVPVAALRLEALCR
jgi:hypothetical protein